VKVGDLVELSAQGARLLYCRGFHAKIGIVIDVRPTQLYPIFVQWFGAPPRTIAPRSPIMSHQRANLKFVSKA